MALDVTVFHRSSDIVFPPPKWDAGPNDLRPKPATVIRLPLAELTVYDLERLHNAVGQIHSLFPNSVITIERRAEQPSEPVTNRDKVLAVTKYNAATVPDISKATGVDPASVRGVLSAPDLEFRRERIGREMAYQYVGKRERKRNKTKRSADANNGEP